MMNDEPPALDSHQPLEVRLMLKLSTFAILASVLAASLASSYPAYGSEACGGKVATLPFSVASPEPPSAYQLPTGATLVSTTFDLQAALAWDPDDNEKPKDIVLADGVYTPDDLDGDFLTLHGSHRLWAQNLGQATLKFGVVIGSPTNENLALGAELHGLHFDIEQETHGASANPAHRSFGVLIWGTARGVVIEDSSFDGGGVVDFGIGAYRHDGLVVRRVEIEGFKRFGLFTDMDPTRPVTGHSVLEDIRVSRVGDNEWAWSFEETHEDYDPAYPNYDAADPYKPSQEVGIWVGAPGRLSRAWVRDIARVGVIAAGDAFGVLMEDLDVDDIGWRPIGPSSVNGAGLYFDNQAYHSTFRRFCVGPGVVKGLVSEWDNNTFPRGIRNRVENGLVEASRFGIFFDQGTIDSTVSSVYFRNASWAGLTLHNNVWYGDDSSNIEVLYRDLHDVGLPQGSCLVTAHHPNNSTPCHAPPPTPQSP
ncbi:MAG: hypothetical protein AAF725_19990 [Acidobacteriota bacterium]